MFRDEFEFCAAVFALGLSVGIGREECAVLAALWLGGLLDWGGLLAATCCCG